MERQYTRVYADTEGASHVEESDVLCTSRAYTPSALPMQVSSSPPTTPCACLRLPVGWSGGAASLAHASNGRHTGRGMGHDDERPRGAALCTGAYGARRGDRRE